VKSVNAVGPGGRLEVLCLKKPDAAGNGYVLMDTGNVISRQAGWFGSGSADWREHLLVVEVPEDGRFRRWGWAMLVRVMCTWRKWDLSE
jgi:hypothetical protein